MGKWGRAEDKGKGEGDDLIGILKVAAIFFLYAPSKGARVFLDG
jgi:hypothetical protein